MADSDENLRRSEDGDRNTGDEAEAISEVSVPSSERLESMDVLRGFALLGILPINILSIALPGMTFMNPMISGGFTGGNYALWWVSYLFFEEKMMTIFSMLFGAGLVLMTDRMQQSKRSPAAFFYRRAAILLVIGLAHAYLLWPGDILVSYALCGMLVYPLRKLAPWWLLLIGLLATLPSLALSRSEATALTFSRGAFQRVQAANQRGEAPTAVDSAVAGEWDDARKTFHPTSEELAQDLEDSRHDSYWQSAASRAQGAFFVETNIFATTLLWVVSGRMLLGMALMQWGVFSASRSMRFYAMFALVGYGFGLPVVAWGAQQLVANNFDVVYMHGGGTEFNEFGSLLVALGHVGALSVLYKSGLSRRLMQCLAAVGRMALSNYLMQTVICTTLFYGYGFGMRGSLDRIQLSAVVIAIWALQLSYSPLWLRSFRFGPFEWLWRSLTYGAAQRIWKSQ